MASKSNEKIHREAVAKLKRVTKNKTLFRVPGEGCVGDWRTVVSPYSPAVAAWIRAKCPTAVIANEDLEEAAKWIKVYYAPPVSDN